MLGSTSHHRPVMGGCFFGNAALLDGKRLNDQPPGCAVVPLAPPTVSQLGAVRARTEYFLL